MRHFEDLLRYFSDIHGINFRLEHLLFFYLIDGAR